MTKEDDNCVLRLYSTGRSDIVAWYQIWQAVEATFGTYISELILLLWYTHLRHKASLRGKRTFLLPALVLQLHSLPWIRDADSKSAKLCAVGSGKEEVILDLVGSLKSPREWDEKSVG